MATETGIPKPEVAQQVPSYLIYETLNGRPLYRKGYKDVLAKRKSPGEIMGCGDLQAIIVSAYSVGQQSIQRHCDLRKREGNDARLWHRTCNLDYDKIPENIRCHEGRKLLTLSWNATAPAIDNITLNVAAILTGEGVL